MQDLIDLADSSKQLTARLSGTHWEPPPKFPSWDLWLFHSTFFFRFPAILGRKFETPMLQTQLAIWWLMIKTGLVMRFSWNFIEYAGRTEGRHYTAITAKHVGRAQVHWLTSIEVSDSSTAVWISCSTPHHDISWPHCLMLGIFQFLKPLTGLEICQNSREEISRILFRWTSGSSHGLRSGTTATVALHDHKQNVVTAWAQDLVPSLVWRWWWFFFLGQGWCHTSYVSSEAVEWVLGMVWDC